jgi:hypothetical protein
MKGGGYVKRDVAPVGHHMMPGEGGIHLISSLCPKPDHLTSSVHKYRSGGLYKQSIGERLMIDAARGTWKPVTQRWCSAGFCHDANAKAFRNGVTDRPSLTYLFPSVPADADLRHDRGLTPDQWRDVLNQNRINSTPVSVSTVHLLLLCYSAVNDNRKVK